MFGQDNQNPGVGYKEKVEGTGARGSVKPGHSGCVHISHDEHCRLLQFKGNSRKLANVVAWWRVFTRRTGLGYLVAASWILINRRKGNMRRQPYLRS